MAGAFSEIVLGGFATAAKQFAASVDAAIAKHGDDLIDPGARWNPDVLALHMGVGNFDQIHSSFQIVPDVASSLRGGALDEFTSALRAARDASDRYLTRQGTTTVAPYAALRDAANGLAELTTSAARTGRPTRVVVGGNGTAGLTVANLLREAGVDVMVVAPRHQARLGSVMIDRRGWDVLERAGGGEVLRRAPLDERGNYAMASFQALEDPLHGAALARGVRFGDQHVVQGVEDLDDGVRVSLSRQDGTHAQSIDADWYVDATGGNSPVSTSAPFRRELFEGTFNALPSERGFHAVAADAVPDRGIGWTAADGTFAINDVQSGRLTAYRGLDSPDPSPLSVEDARGMLQALDVDPATMLGTPWSFTARQTLARSAAQGRTLIVGDGAGTVLPHQQAGIFLALTDAERAAKTIITSRTATRDAIEAAVRSYDEQTRRIRAGATFGDDGEILKQVAGEAGEEIAEATERATRAHDAGTRAMHRLFLA